MKRKGCADLEGFGFVSGFKHQGVRTGAMPVCECMFLSMSTQKSRISTQKSHISTQRAICLFVSACS